MGKIIMIASQKGGVGKTTTALNLGFSLSRFGGRVLLVDADVQGSLAVASNLRKRTDKGLIDVLKGNAEPKEVIATTRDGGMSVVGMGSPRTDDVMFFEEEAKKGNVGGLLRKLAVDFQYTLIDAPSGIGGTVTTLMGASDGVIATVQTKALAIKTLPSFLRAYQWSRDNLNRSLRFEGVLLTMVDEGSVLERQSFDEVKRAIPSEFFFGTWIPLNPVFEEATMRAIPVALLPEGQAAARPYIDLALEMRNRHAAEGAHDAETAGLF